ncbi:hypothetical protein [Caulobacter sp. CCH9-E1]|uniref:hypothetical protein n=1 Tax=Caulobacter sp. CCH9-E1 TaxID=1768768 RepID=UPI0008318DCF|nr:hypothetical protein [Caulobacter sp. CCH9-E1]
MSRDYYYHTTVTLLPGVTPHDIIRLWHPEADLSVFPEGTVSWEHSNGPAFFFSDNDQVIQILVDTEAHHGFADEFEDFLLDLSDRVVGAALVTAAGEDRILYAYGRDPKARTNALVAHRRGLLNEARKALLLQDPRADTNEDGVLDLVQTLKDLLEEAIEVHIYGNDDSRPADCSFIGAVARAQALLTTKGR